MKYGSTVVGAAICGALCFGVWPEMWKSYGIMGGWLTSAIVIAICWYMNHWLAVMSNPPGRLWVDQGWAIGGAGIALAMVRFGAHFLRCVPVLLCCLAGGALAGGVALHVKRNLAERVR